MDRRIFMKGLAMATSAIAIVKEAIAREPLRDNKVDVLMAISKVDTTLADMSGNPINYRFRADAFIVDSMLIAAKQAGKTPLCLESKYLGKVIEGVGGSAYQFHVTKFALKTGRCKCPHDKVRGICGNMVIWTGA